MKKHLFIITALIMSMVSCQKEEAGNVSTEDSAGIHQMNYTILEENEITSEELFSAATALEEFTGKEVINNLRNSFNEAACNQVTVEGTKSIIPPLLYKTAKISYITKDQANKDVAVSALIVYPALRKMDKVLLINHGTHVGKMMVPTNYTSVEAVLAATGALCILPDYVGVGGSSIHCDNYLNSEVNGRTSVDALFTLFDYAKKKKLSLASNYKTYVVGYSQGGAVSLAALRQIQRLTPKEKEQVKLKRVICGDGPYDLRATFEQYVQDDQQGQKMGIGAVVPLVINGMFCSYPKELGKYNYEDFFTEWALSTGVPQAVRENNAGILDILGRMAGAKLSDILNMDFIEENPKAYNTLLSMMDKQNLCKGWSPAYPLKFLHCNPDGVVPFVNMTKAVEGLKNSYVETPDEIEINTCLMSGPLAQHVYGMAILVERFLLGRYY